MHELSIVQKIVNIADDAAAKNDLKRLSVVRLRLGQMAAAHPEQLQFGFKTYAKGSRLENAELLIEEVPLELECLKCGHKFGDTRFNDHDFAHAIAHAPLAYISPPCPKCGADNVKITHGQEMELVELVGD